jgi:hypothetical protein
VIKLAPKSITMYTSASHISPYTPVCQCIDTHGQPALDKLQVGRGGVP